MAARYLHSPLSCDAGAVPHLTAQRQALSRLLGLGRGLVAAAAAGLAVGCMEAAEPERVPLAFKASALSACGGQATALSEVGTVEVTVQDSEGKRIYAERASVSGGRVGVGGVPEGSDATVTLAGLVGSETKFFGRRRGVLVEKGRTNPVQVALTRFGGASCPAGDNEYTHRTHPAVTELGAGYYLISGGFTAVQGTGPIDYVTNEGSRKAFVYDAASGSLRKVSNSMVSPRGGHAAAVFRTPTKTRAILFGGATKLTFDAANTNGFPFRFDVADALSSLEIFEWDTGTNPAETGAFVSSGLENTVMRAKRFMPTVAEIASDGLILVCDGGPWGADEPPEYKECDVFDGAEGDSGAFLPASKNFPFQYRAGGAVATVSKGETTRLLFVGGSKDRVVEVYRSSTEQRAGSGGVFNYPDNGQGDVPRVSFPSLTPLGDGRFAMIGGVAWNGGGFDGPAANNSWLLTVREDGARVNVDAQPLPEFRVGRYFHTAAAPAGDRLVVLGGFTGTGDLAPTDNIRFLDGSGTGADATYTGFKDPPSTEEAFLARGGMGSILLDNDTVLIAGGVASADDMRSDAPGALEVYTPSNLLPVARD